MGSRNKYEWDHEQGGIVLSRFLFASVVYPTDYGFFPETRVVTALIRAGRELRLAWSPAPD